VDDGGGTEVTHSWTVDHGQHSFVVAGTDMASINLADLVLRDPDLYFPLRGTAANLAAQDKDDRQAGHKAGEQGQSQG
jgi:hypothetical protein